ncbi:MBOAT family protein [Patescibacteria group bacterium]|nr:MBOAT family protein [Patescibacteria group bacterium]
MLFNSLEFIIFLVIVFFIYWKLKRKQQNFFLVLVSYVFYGWWDWRFLSLIIISSLVDFIVGRKIYQTEKKSSRKSFLFLSIFINLGLLGFFKYFNFFVASFQSLLASLGVPEISMTTLNIILPVGISFYTFQTMSYTIDIYRRKIEPTNDLLQFFAFVSFFPQLVAGPIERAANLLVQFGEKRIFKLNEAFDGCRQILWGFFKKIVIADTLAIAVNSVYKDLVNASGGQLLIATFFFAFQLYCDFSGYSDIAIGTAKLFGFKLMRNFSYPYFSRNIAEFWRRWHISLSTWLRDYLYYPLVYSAKNKTRIWIYTSTFITFVLIGLWHGAGWNYIAMGALFGFYLVFSSITKNIRKKIAKFISLRKSS